MMTCPDHRRRPLWLLCLLSLLLVACNATIEASGPTGSPDGADAVGIAAGKADGSLFTQCELDAIVDFVNDLSTDYHVLRAAGVHGAASRRIPSYRPFDNAQAVDAVPYVGPVAFEQLAEAVAQRCFEPAPQTAEVIFSPRYYDESHLARVIELLDGARHSIDIAMYSFRDSSVAEAIERATARGVSVRMVFESANTHRRDPEGTMSARLEEAGVDVRYVNKIMHHKFAIIDGPRTALDLVYPGILLTGSGNWSYNAATRYDENMIVLFHDAEATLSFQREFNRLWDNSRDLVWNEALLWFGSMVITDDMIPDDESFEVAFTSANFDVWESTRYGPTFSRVRGRDTVSSRLVALIEAAESSIWLASGHLRLRPVAEALLAAHDANPELDIRVYLDGQEYLSSSSHWRQTQDLDECLERAAGSQPRTEDCVDRGFRFSYLLHRAGIPVRFKYYAYRWDITYAVQMHHKYMLIDGRILASGSYNLSDNAEHNTMENIAIYHLDRYPGLIDAFERNFGEIWDTGDEEGLYEGLLGQIDLEHSAIPLVFAPMALDWDQVTHLKREIRSSCPEVDTEEFRTNAGAHRNCPM
jgi:phosphatidylserine/phosphatidylglycerophosphate/cardiolipin synthase-like enzyme